MRNLLLKCLPGLLCFLIPAANVMAQGGDRVPLDIQQYFQSQKFKEPTYKDTVAKDRLAIIKPISEPNSNVTLLVDTKGGKNIFPIARKPRRFKSESELQEFMAKRINGDIETAQVGVNGVYRQEGAAYFYDPNPGITYRITDPILAILGGTRGVIYVNGKEVCVDTDWECDSEYASYFEPVGETTAPHSIDQCGTVINGVPVCVRHTSFFNKTWFFSTYVRHGVNAQFTTWAALPSSVLIVGGLEVFSPTNPVIPLFVTGDTIEVGQNFAEEAIYCWGNCFPGLEDSDGVCGVGRVIDPDLDSNPRVTGNGPRNNTSSANCPF